jgi:hypothetical protein
VGGVDRVGVGVGVDTVGVGTGFVELGVGVASDDDASAHDMRRRRHKKSTVEMTLIRCIIIKISLKR